LGRDGHVACTRRHTCRAGAGGGAGVAHSSPARADARESRLRHRATQSALERSVTAAIGSRPVQPLTRQRPQATLGRAQRARGRVSSRRSSSNGAATRRRRKAGGVAALPPHWSPEAHRSEDDLRMDGSQQTNRGGHGACSRGRTCRAEAAPRAPVSDRALAHRQGRRCLKSPDLSETAEETENAARSQRSKHGLDRCE